MTRGDRLTAGGGGGGGAIICGGAGSAQPTRVALTAKAARTAAGRSEMAKVIR